MPSKGTIGAVFVLRRIVWKLKVKSKKLYFIFVNLQSTFNWDHSQTPVPETPSYFFFTSMVFGKSNSHFYKLGRLFRMYLIRMYLYIDLPKVLCLCILAFDYKDWVCLKDVDGITCCFHWLTLSVTKIVRQGLQVLCPTS